jgi:endonuclease/exonuclease/phosphatase (EEP) superfamily protein YafD
MPSPHPVRRAVRGVALVLAALVVVATALPAAPSGAWWVRVFDYPRVQTAALGAVALVLYALAGRGGPRWGHVLVAALALAVAYQAVQIAPYTPLASPEVVVAEGAGGPTLSVLVANVLMENREAERFLDVVRRYDPDLVLVLEPDAWWERALRPLDATHAYALKEPLSNTYGMLLYSRLPLLDAETRYLVEPDIPSMHARVRLAEGRAVQLHALHPDPPNPQYATETTERDGELLLIAREVGRRGGPAVVVGDFNDVAWSRTTRLFQETSGLLDPRVGRGTFSTYNARWPLLRWPLDHVFHSDHFALVRLERGPDVGSDHFPIFAELAVDPEAEWIQDAPAPEADDLREADEAIDEAGAPESL